jgi:6-phospho-beta-glucosidase
VGQETTGPGGFAKALRTIPVLLDIAHDMVEVAPGAHLINFTNPSGIITEALLKYTDTPTVGLCNSPFGFQQGIAQQLGVAPERIQLDYVGLNHLSWIRGVRLSRSKNAPRGLPNPRFWPGSGDPDRAKLGLLRLDGEDVFDQVLEGAIALARADESPFSPGLLETLRMLPSYYLTYYYNHDQMVAEQRWAEKPRGEIVQEIEASLLELYADPNLRHKPKLLEKRGGAHYSTVAVAVISAIHHDKGEVHIVNTLNNGALPNLPPHCVVELSSVINGSGARAVPVAPMPPVIRGLAQAVKTYEELTVLAGVEGDEQAALQALLAHPLVPSFAVAQGLWAAIKEANRAYLSQFEGET